MKITILNVAITESPNKNGKLFKTADVAFKNNTFGDKVEGKKVTSYSKAAFDVLVDAKPGDVFEVVTEKNGQYVEWKEVNKAQPGDKSSPATVVQRGSQTVASPKSTYETAEERAKRQVYIVRQSSIANAVATLSAGAKAAPKSDDVITLAKQYESYVLGVKEFNATGFDDVPDFDPDFNNLGTEPQID